MLRINDGCPAPLGAKWDGKGVNFALFSAHAAEVELCLFHASGKQEQNRIKLQRTEQVWHIYVDGLMPGQLYGYRVHGLYDPPNGFRFNPHKLLLDPYARQISGQIKWHDSLYDHRPGSHKNDFIMDRRDSAPMMPKCVVESSAEHWDADRRVCVPWRDTLIYETHVKGMTYLHPAIEPGVRGSYAALGHPAVIEHLLKLGVTTLELMPIQAFADDAFLVKKGLRNYWGYSTLGYFAPEPRYFGEDGALGLKAAITALHQAGIEIILDVVYNHTAEGDHTGPTLSFRGIDNQSYYKLVPEDLRYYWDCTGCGNTFDLSHPRVLQLVLDSLRHWVKAYHIDGFRFDLASALLREPYGIGGQSSFLNAIGQDPVLSRVKLIAEPWDLGEHGYRVGGFPPGWGEWNDKFRDSARAFWRGDEGQLPEFATRITGSRDLYEKSSRHPFASVHFITSHDGFTLHDLVSYSKPRNEANLEDNNDGHKHNLSWNCGAEGPTADPEIAALRARQSRNLLATCLFSLGTPMLLMGDEFQRSQSGNNNPYCQDNETSWLSWAGGSDPSLLVFLQNLSRLRRKHLDFHRKNFFTGEAANGTGLKDVYWLAPEGREMTSEDWFEPRRQTAGLQIGNSGDASQRILLLISAAAKTVEFHLDPGFPCLSFKAVFSSAEAEGFYSAAPQLYLKPGGSFCLASRSIVLLEHV